MAYHDEDLTLYRVGGDHPAAAGRGIVLAAHWVWLGLLMLSGVLAGLLTAWLRRVEATGWHCGATKVDNLGPSATIAFNAANSVVKTAIVGIDDGIVAADVTVTGSAGVYTVTVPGVLTVDGASPDRWQPRCDRDGYAGLTQLYN